MLEASVRRADIDRNLPLYYNVMRFSRRQLSAAFVALLAASPLLVSGRSTRAQSVVAPPSTPAPFTFAVFGDNRPARSDLPVPDVFRQIVREVRLIHPAFVMTTGDLIYGSDDDPDLVAREYAEVMPIVGEVGVPIYFAAGNHEIRGKAVNEALYRKHVSPNLYYSFDYGPAHLVVLDSDIVGQAGRIMGKQMAWFQEDLKAARTRGAKHVFVFMHQQPYPVSLHIGSSLDKYPVERDVFQTLLRKFKVEALITGHEHLFDDSVHGGVREIISGGAGAPLYPSSRGGSFNHYLLVTIDGDRSFVTVVKPGSAFASAEVLTAPAGVVQATSSKPLN